MRQPSKCCGNWVTKESNQMSNEHWIWGHHSVEGALATVPELVLEVLCEKGGLSKLPEQLQSVIEDTGVKVREQALPKVNADGRTQGIVARLKYFPTVRWQDFKDDFDKALSEPKPSQWAILDRVQDPRNYGAVLRSAAAFGIKGIFVTMREQAPLTGVVAAASAGNLFRVPVIEVSNLKHVVDAAREAAAHVFGLDMGVEDLDTGLREAADCSVVWVLGSEGSGVRPGLREGCTKIVSIPMVAGVESLNASAAATVAFYAGARGRR